MCKSRLLISKLHPWWHDREGNTRHPAPGICPRHHSPRKGNTDRASRKRDNLARERKPSYAPSTCQAFFCGSNIGTPGPSAATQRLSLYEPLAGCAVPPGNSRLYRRRITGDRRGISPSSECEATLCFSAAFGSTLFIEPPDRGGSDCITELIGWPLQERAHLPAP